MYKFFILFLLLSSSNLFSADTADVPIDEKEKKILFVKVSDVPSMATQAITDINDISKLFEEIEEISKINSDLKPYLSSIDISLNDTSNKYLQYTSLKELLSKEQNLKIYLSKLQKWNLVLDNRIKVLDENKNKLQDYSKLWKTTLTNAKKELAPKVLLSNISTLLKTIKETEKTAKKRYDSILTNSNLINIKTVKINSLLKKTVDAKNSVSRNVFEKNSLSFSSLLKEKSFDFYAYLSSAFMYMKGELEGLIKYYASSNKIFLFSFLSFIVIVFIGIFNYFYRKRTLFIYQESYMKKEYFFISLPFSTAIILLSLLNFFIFNDIPASIKQFQLLVIIIPIFRILKKYIPKEFNKYYYIYIFLYVLSLIEQDANGFELDARLFSLLLTALLFTYLVLILKNRMLDSIVNPKILKFTYKIIILSTGLLIVSFVADIYGATLLANNITSGVFTTSYTFLIFYLLSVILTGYIIILLRRRIASASYSAEQLTSSLEKVTTFFIKLFMSIWWLKILMKEIGAYSYIIEGKDFIIALSWQIGAATISLESIFNFIAIIVGTWFIVKLVNILLEVEVFSRFKLPRGVPTVITTVLNYFLTITGSLIALVSLGVTIEQFALVFGALGVGIGFGLRNIIANFISGIIMVFERPIQIGDTIEINNTMGTVEAIQTRSSIIKTFDGSEVIIPNADFIAKEITNWTLSDERRRKTLIFKVDTDSDIEKVLEIITNIVRAHPDVLDDPEPMATFLGFGDYYLEFKAYFWLNDNLIMAQSDIAVEIYKTLKKEGIKMPMPKQRFIKEEI